MTVGGATIALGIAGLLSSSAASAEVPCPGAVGAGPVIVCTTVDNETIYVPYGGTTVPVGGQTVGPISGPITTPAETVTTPGVPITSPTTICYALDCLTPGEVIVAVPSQTVTVPAKTVPLPVTVPAVTVPAKSVTVPASVPVPVPTVWLLNDPTAGPMAAVEGKIADTEQQINDAIQPWLDAVDSQYNQYVPPVERILERVLDDPALFTKQACDAVNRTLGLDEPLLDCVSIATIWSPITFE